MTGLGSLVLAAVALSVLELEGTCAGQLMVSRPLVIGPLAGLAFGNPELGAGLGLLCELLGLASLPVGGYLPLNATVAASASLLLALGAEAVPAECAFPAGLAAGLAHRRLETGLRRRRDKLGRRVEESLRRGEKPGFSRLAARELTLQALTTLGVLLVFVLLRAPLARAFSLSPGAVREGLRTALAVSPWLALASLAHALRVVW